MLSFLMFASKLLESCDSASSKQGKFNKDETYCFRGSAFISIKGDNNITQFDSASGYDTPKITTLLNKNKVFSIQKDSYLATRITCNADNGCEYKIITIGRYSNIYIQPNEVNQYDEYREVNYTIKSLVAIEPVNAYINLEFKNMDSKTFSEATTITYILDEDKEYSTIHPKTPCAPMIEKDKGSIIHFKFEYNTIAYFPRQFKQISFTEKSEGKIRELPTEDGLKDWDSLNEYKDSYDYSKPYSCDPFHPYGKPTKFETFKEFFGECNQLVEDQKVYLQTVKAQPGKGICFWYPRFMVDSEQNYFVELQNYTHYEIKEDRHTRDIYNATGERYFIQKPFLVAPKYNTFGKLTCNDTVECTFLFSKVFDTGIDHEKYPGNQEIHVALNSEFKLQRKLRQTLSIYDYTAITHLTNNEFNIEITTKSGIIHIEIDGNEKDPVFIRAGETHKYSKSQGCLYILPSSEEEIKKYAEKSRKILENDDKEITAEYELKMTINKNVKTSDKPIFEGKTYSGEVNNTPISKSDLGQPTDNTPTPEQKLGTNLSPGAIAGIVIAAIAVIAIICVLVWFFVFHNKPSKEGSGSGQDV